MRSAESVREYNLGKRAGRRIAHQAPPAARRSIRQDYLATARYSWDRAYMLGVARGMGRS